MAKEKEPQIDFQKRLFYFENKEYEIEAQDSRVKREMELLEKLKDDKKLAKELETIQKIIKEGRGSTGDKIEDYVFVNFAHSKERLSQLREINEGLFQHQRELVIVKRVELKPFVGDYQWRGEFTMGNIKKSNSPIGLNIETGEIYLSEKKSFTFEQSNFYPPKGFSSKNPVLIQNWELVNLGKSIEEVYINQEYILSSITNELKEARINKARGHKEPQIEIIIGNEKCLKVLRENRKDL